MLFIFILVSIFLVPCVLYFIKTQVIDKKRKAKEYTRSIENQVIPFINDIDIGLNELKEIAHKYEISLDEITILLLRIKSISELYGLSQDIFQCHRTLMDCERVIVSATPILAQYQLIEHQLSLIQNQLPTEIQTQLHIGRLQVSLFLYIIG